VIHLPRGKRLFCRSGTGWIASNIDEVKRPRRPVLNHSCRAMESNAPASSLSTFKELRLDLAPGNASSIVQIQLPRTSKFALSSQSNRRVISHFPISRNEDELRRGHLASASSMFFRGATKYPRNILWRILENQTVLELRSVDMSKNEKEHNEASVILQVGFPVALRAGCIGFADASQIDALNIFALTENNDLYSLGLKSSFFFKATASEVDVDQWSKCFRPSSFSISQAHRMTFSSDEELIFSLHDGRLMRLTRQAGADGSVWQETAYNDGHWGASLRGLIRWQASNTVRYEGSSLDPNTALAAVPSRDGYHMISVAINHTLKSWNIVTGKTTFSKDLLNTEREPNEQAKVMLDPGMTHVLCMDDTIPSAFPGDQYYIFTFTPHAGGIFKVWGVRDADLGKDGVRDVFDEQTLRAPDPGDGAMWTVTDWRISGLPNKELEMWILFRLNKRHRLYYRKFSGLAQLANEWQEDWEQTVIDPSKREPANEPPFNAPSSVTQDIASSWLGFIFTPGRVPDAIIATALSVHMQSREMQNSVSKSMPLRQYVAAYIGHRTQSQASRTQPAAMAKFRADLNAEWSSLWVTITELDGTRYEPLSLALDSTRSMSWIVSSGSISAVRQCAETEMCAHNKSRGLMAGGTRMLAQSIEIVDAPGSTPPEESAALIEAAARFRCSFSDAQRLTCTEAVETELWQDVSHCLESRIQSMYDHCNFTDYVSDQQYRDLAVSLGGVGGFDGLDTDTFFAILQTLPDHVSERSHLVSTACGRKALVTGAQEMINLHIRVLTDLLLLVVFVQIEIDPEEFSMPSFDAGRVFDELVQKLQMLHVMRWLATHSAQHADRNSTLLQELFAKDIRPQSTSHQPESAALSNSVCDLLKWITGGNDSTITLDQISVNIQCSLLKAGDLALASSFLRYQPSTAWATYIHGRHALMNHDPSSAAVCFRKAAYNMSQSAPSSSFYASASDGFLTSLEARHLASGLADYYSHVVDLFSSKVALGRAQSQIAQFAALALQFQQPDHSHGDQQRSDLMSRLLHSSLAMGDYETAFSALARHSDAALRRKALKELVDDMIASGAVEELLRLPFTRELKSDVDTILSASARSETAREGHVTGPGAVKTLYAWRVAQGDLRGAAACVMEKLRAEKATTNGRRRKRGASQGKDSAVDEYLVALNALALLGQGQHGDADKGEGWVFVEKSSEEGGGRSLLRLQDVRREYQAEMDMREEWERGQFAITGANEDEDDADGDLNMTM